MGLHARRLVARMQRLDPATVDGIVALALLIEIELQVWLSPYVHHRVPAALGGVALVGRLWRCAVAGRSQPSSWA